MNRRVTVALALLAVMSVAFMGHRTFAAPDEPDPALEEEYNKKAKTVDSFSADAQYTLALWCEEKGMATRFEEHLFNAYLLDPKHEGANNKLKGLLKQKEEKLAATDANAHFELGEWCNKGRLKEDAKRFFEKAVAIDPEHAKARAKLGYVKLGDKWVTVEEATKLTGTTDAAVEAIGKALEIEFKQPFICKPAGPYMLYLQKEKEGKSVEYAMDSYVDAFKWFYDGIKEKFGEVLGLPPAENRVITVAIVSNKDAMTDYLKRKGEPKGMSIMYDRESKRLVMHAMEHPLRAVAHEGSHQFLYEAMKDNTAKTSLWIQEGIACFTEAFKRSPDTLKFDFGTMNERLVYKVRTMVKEKKNLPLAEFLELKYEDWSRELKDIFLKAEKEVQTDDEPLKALERKRQQAWSLFYFLYDFEKGKYRQKLMEYLKHETTTGKSGLEAFKQFFGDPAQIEKEWLEYVPTLSAMD